MGMCWWASPHGNPPVITRVLSYECIMWWWEEGAPHACLSVIMAAVSYIDDSTSPLFLPLVVADLNFNVDKLQHHIFHGRYMNCSLMMPGDGRSRCCISLFYILFFFVGQMIFLLHSIHFSEFL